MSLKYINASELRAVFSHLTSTAFLHKAPLQSHDRTYSKQVITIIFFSYLHSIRQNLLVEHTGANEGVADGVGIAVAARSPVLEVALVGLGDTAWNTDADVAVGDAAAEVVDAAGLALAGKPALVVLALARVVRLDVLLVPLAQLLDRLLDLLDAIVGAHRLGREVAVGARAVPVALHGFRVQGDDHAVFLGDAVQDEPGHPEVVAGGDAEAGSNLKFTQSISQDFQRLRTLSMQNAIEEHLPGTPTGTA